MVLLPGLHAAHRRLIREADLAARQRAFDAPAWLGAQGAPAQPGERVVSLFCYEQPALPALLDQLAQRPALLLVTPGHAARQVRTLLGPTLHRGLLRAVELPALPQPEYDHLLWAADLNFVRGEDSFVRAQWAGKPFVWQIYPQHDGVHLDKLEAFLDRFGAAPELRAFARAWNDRAAGLPPLPRAEPWRGQCDIWRDSLLAQPDLSTQLLEFAAETR